MVESWDLTDKSFTSNEMRLHIILQWLIFFKKIFFGALFFTSALHALCQSERGLSGTEFWLTCTQNLYRPDSLTLLVAPESTDTITVFNPQMNVSLKPVPVKQGAYNRISVPANMVYSVLAFGGQGTGVVVRSKRNIQLFAYNILPESIDMTAILPVQYLKNGQKYILHGWGGNANREAQAAVLAIDTGNTTVRVNLKADLFTGQGNGSSFVFSLKQGQVFVLQALDSQDLSGTIVSVLTGCKRIAVFYGAKCARVRNIPGCATYDHIYEQNWPAALMGKEYIVPPVPENSRFQISVAALFDTTVVKIFGSVVNTLNKGETWKIEMNTLSPVVVQSDKPISCVQLLNSSGCNGSVGNKGDAALLNIAVNTPSAYTRKAGYTVYNGPFYNHHVSVIGRGSVAPVLKQNGVAVNIPGGFIPVNIFGSLYWYGTFKSATNNTYELQSDSGFMAYLYGLAPNEAYATCFGVAPVNYNSDFSINPNPICRTEQLITFKASGDSLNNLRWLFGDGNTSSNNPAIYRYNKPGFYQVKLLNETFNRCKTDTVLKLIKVGYGINMNLPRDTQPCRGFNYKVELPSISGITYKWENGSSSPSQSFTSNRKAILVTKDTSGCISTDTIDVRFRECSKLDLRLANVFTPNGDGANDEWVVVYEGWDEITVKIINRWGEDVANYSLPNDAHWNGKVEGKFTTLPTGTYFYYMQCKDNESGSVKKITGSINLIR